MLAPSDKFTNTEVPLQILLFVDQRPNSKEQIRQIRSFFKKRESDNRFELQIVDVGEQPYLAEHFRLVATPALIKIHPEPRQILTGSDLVAQLERWWSRWQRAAEEFLLEEDAIAKSAKVDASKTTGVRSVIQSAELLKLSDEVFRLNQEREELKLQLQFKDQIIAMLAHDLRNPLTAASIAVETLEIGHKSGDRQSSRFTPVLILQLLNHARSQLRTIDRMITDILQAAKGSSAELHIQPQKLDLGAMCREALDSLHARSQAKHLKVNTDIPNDLPFVYADPERVRQVFVNILDNAIKYTPTNGAIHVSILHRTTQKVQVSICDSGPGIPEDNRERIFEDHFRLQRDQAQDGYGIGLSLCQRIVRSHYGQIWVDSTPNQGSCFHFTLPVFRLQQQLIDGFKL
ncbi:MAG: histidine kinase [Myxacorys chilensis ATA2-1-KO14]|jgi:two-component system clock-associated histidine kinase SasA|nr:histidine kinase [Myxacorys chilensis ATA2-1-KO14]